ncbi:MAG: alanine--tRNA ligase [Anaerolineae bacterium]
MITSAETREQYLKYFEEHGHTRVRSSSLVPDDPTLLFTNAGMVQFKDSFLGLEDRGYKRATTAQKCMRVSGKHNDLENVGPSPRHHTFFEMMGNFSFGDYFKEGAIRFGYELLTDVYGISPGRLYYTIFEDDDEAFDIWVNDIGVGPERVYRMGEQTNFWMMADVGPCGPTSEIHYDFGPGYCTCGRDDCSVQLDNDCGRWLELWNLVFMQFDQASDGTRTRLPAPGVDTGLGLERLVAVLQGVYSNYETDLFTNIMDRLQALLGHTDAEREEHIVGYRVIADHGRAMAFLAADGVMPGNEGRSYVMRLIMRRAMRFGKLIGFSEPFLAQVSDSVIETMGDHYSELRDREHWVKQVITEEERRFERTLDTGLTILDNVIADLQAQGKSEIPGQDAFRLHDTYGFPVDLTEDVAEEYGMTVDRAGYEREMEEKRDRDRETGKFVVGEEAETYRRLDLPPTKFLGYETTVVSNAHVIALVQNRQRVEHVSEGDEVQVVLDRTPFYAEAGGQVGDTGRIITPGGTVTVEDTHSPIKGVIIHYGQVAAGSISQGDLVEARVDVERRMDIMRNHTATHLLHKALQSVLGEHAQQRGSLVAPDRLRFDFAHLSALSEEEVREIEHRVNEKIRADLPVEPKYTTLDEARRLGAMMLFGEKYGENVRMVTIDDYSRELCGGTHLHRTGQIGGFLITNEGSVGAGLRRIEALTGRGAERYMRERLELLGDVAGTLGAQGLGEVRPRLHSLLDEVKGQRREIDRLRRRIALQETESILNKTVVLDGVEVVAAQVEAMDMEGLRERIDFLRDRLGSGVIVLGSVIDGRPQLVAAVTSDLVAKGLDAGDLVQQVAAVVGGSGGGRPMLAQAGGRDPGKLDEALSRVKELVSQALERKYGS